ncbi:hypothetical protein L3Q82_004706 [Scortum barcoo]|uniref:Uncharacterized protein n=1 Tax=Scortum barcoo TaxID=214431 RepID=A0ACB8VK58_9TELE|nr:hypothetical protein L3Q82_004706 [Scortum barcoo]
MGSCILPCSFNNNDSVLIHWTTKDIYVHSYYKDKDQLTHQEQRFRGRTSLFKEQISRGNASLQLTEVEVQDEGRYLCYISTDTATSSYINLKVDAPVGEVDIQQVGNRITCSSEGIYPEPELTWSTSPPSNVTFNNTATVQQTEQQLYNISSSLIVSDSVTDLVYSCTVSTRTNSRRSSLPLCLKLIILIQTRTDRTVSEEWRQQVKDVSESGKLTLQELSSNQEGIYTCELRNEEETKITNTFLRTDNCQGFIIGVVAASVIVGAVLVGLVIYCKKTRGCQRDTEPNNDGTLDIELGNTDETKPASIFSVCGTETAIPFTSSNMTLTKLIWRFNRSQIILIQTRTDRTVSEEWRQQVKDVSESGKLTLQELSSNQEGIYTCELRNEEETKKTNTFLRTDNCQGCQRDTEPNNDGTLDFKAPRSMCNSPGMDRESGPEKNRLRGGKLHLPGWKQWWQLPGLPGTDVVLHWINVKGDTIVHSYYNNRDQLAQQDQRFRGRTSLFKEQISRGNASLQLTEVEVQDQGRYKCFTSLVIGNKESFINVKVDAPVGEVDIQQVGNRITCRSEGIYPEPELTWSTSPPSNVTFNNTATVQQTEQQLYNISSSLIVSDSVTDLVYICTVSTFRTNRRRASLFKAPSIFSVCGNETTIPCTSSNTTLTKLIWRFNHSQIILIQTRTDRTVSEEWRQQVKDVSESGKLTLQELSSNQEGIYTCELRNEEETKITNTFLRTVLNPEFSPVQVELDQLSVQRVRSLIAYRSTRKQTAKQDIELGNKDETKPDTEVSCAPMGSCILPCIFIYDDSVLIHWTTKDIYVHSYYKDQDQLKHQEQRFRGRTSLFKEQISRGNASLQLTEVEVQDQGRYLCYTRTVIGNKESFITPVGEVDIQQVGNRITCSSEGIYPEPELTWSTSPPSNVTFKSTATVQQTEQQLYNISSSLIVSDSVTDLVYSCTVSTRTNSRRASLFKAPSIFSGCGTETTIPCTSSNTTLTKLIWRFNHSQIILIQTRTDRTVSEEWRQQVKDVSESGKLTLQELSSNQEGIYTCELRNEEETKITNTFLRTDNCQAPVGEIDIQQVGNRITCSSEGIYPEPELTWSTSPPSNVTFNNTATVQQTEQQLYNISSSLIVSDSVTDLVYSCTVSTRTNSRRATLFKAPSIFSVCGTETTIPCTSSNMTLTKLIWRFNHSQIILIQTRTDRTVSEEWRQQVKDVSESGKLTLQELSSNQEGIYTCELRNEEEMKITNTFLRTDNCQENLTNIIMLVVTALLIFGLVVGLVYYKRKQGCQRDTEPNNDGTLDFKAPRSMCNSPGMDRESGPEKNRLRGGGDERKVKKPRKTNTVSDVGK